MNTLSLSLASWQEVNRFLHLMCPTIAHQAPPEEVSKQGVHPSWTGASKTMSQNKPFKLIISGVLMESCKPKTA
jgi:hypothetical protein